jgi:fructose-1,6-bisphosphatase/inositol monophosphatase family enzyme
VYAIELTVRHREVGCWPWDVCAGVLIATEAGGMATGSHTALKKNKESGTYNDIDDQILIGKYSIPL